MGSVRTRPAVAVVGMGAAGALVSIHLCEAARRRGTPLDLLFIDPAAEPGRGAAYATRDPRHRLNVPAGNMSCYPDEPGHFVRWLCRHGEPQVGPGDFVTRYRFGCYVSDTLGRAVTDAHGTVAVRRLRRRVVDCQWTDRPGGRTAQLVLDDGAVVEADAVVLATGPAPAPVPDWLPPALAASDRFVADPWAPGALTALEQRVGAEDVLLVGTGLTAVDVALMLDRPGRTVHALSRGGLLPQAHAVAPLPPEACREPLGGKGLTGLRAAALRHVARVTRSTGDWRPALDGLRPLTAGLWSALTAEDRAEFVARYASLWNTHRHRMPPATAESVTRMRRTRRLRLGSGRLVDATALPDGSLSVGVGGGRTLRVGWVVNCTGPGRTAADEADPLWRGLLERGEAVPGPLGMGVSTRDGRLLTRAGDTPHALWTLGAPRRGELWETTAVPEIRAQAAAVAGAVLGR